MLIDTHAHLTFKVFDSTLPTLIEEAYHAGITKIITVGIDEESSKKGIDLAQKYHNIYCSVGWHPSTVSNVEDSNWLENLYNIASSPKVVAIGEIGLDYHRIEEITDRKLQERLVKMQQEFFIKQVELAVELGRPCIIHSRKAFNDIIAMTSRFYPRLRAVLHCFTNGPHEAIYAIKMGFYLSFTGIITYGNSTAVQQALYACDEDRYFLETDAPFLAPVPYKGQTCKPAYLVEIAKKVAEIRGESFDQIANESSSNAERFFYLDA